MVDVKLDMMEIVFKLYLYLVQLIHQYVKYIHHVRMHIIQLILIVKLQVINVLQMDLLHVSH